MLACPLTVTWAAEADLRGERAAATLLAVKAMADGDANRRAGRGGCELAAAAGGGVTDSHLGAIPNAANELSIISRPSLVSRRNCSRLSNGFSSVLSQPSALVAKCEHTYCAEHLLGKARCSVPGDLITCCINDD